MNNITKLIIAKKCLDMTKAQADLRGKEFTKVYVAFVNLFAGLFSDQAKFFIAFAENNPQLFSENGLIIEKTDEFGDMMPPDDFMNELGSLLIKAHMIGQDATNKEVASQVTVLMEMKNSFAENYAKNRAGELMSGVNETTKSEVRSLFNTAFKESWTIKEISAAIDEQFSQFGKYRANLIATMEVANSYEVGKKEQFASYQSYFRITGFKRSITQHDSNVRYTHNLNEIDGWIAEDKNFSGTDTDHAPHGFNCRCITTRRMSSPTDQDIIDAQFSKDSTIYLTSAQKVEFSNLMQSMRKKLPFLPKPSKLLDESVADTTVAFYDPSINAFGVNAQNWGGLANSKTYMTDADTALDIPYTIASLYQGKDQVRAIVAHEVGHAVDIISMVYGRDNTLKFAGNVTWETIAKAIDKVSADMVDKIITGDIIASRYPIHRYSDNPTILKMEVFAEAFSAYEMGDFTRMTPEMKSLIDYIYQLGSTY